jgi:hypothetical protein
MCWGEHNWPDSIPNFNGVLTLEMTLERFEGRNTVTQLVKGVVTTFQAGTKDVYFLYSTEIGSRAHSASHSMGTWGCFSADTAAGA